MDSLRVGFEDLSKEPSTEISAAEIIEALCSNYNAVYFYDVKAEEVFILSLGERIASHMGDTYKTQMSYMEYVKIYADKLVSPDYREEFLKELEPENLVKKLADRQYYIYTYLGDKNGKPNYFQMKATKVKDNPNHLVIGFADVDSEVRKEEETKRLLRETAEKLRSINEIKSYLLSSVSEDLSGTISAMKDYGYLAQVGIGDADATKSLETVVDNINAAVKQMNAIAQNIFDISQLEKEQQPQEDQLCSIKDLFKEVQRIHKDELDKKSISLCLDLANVEHDRVFTNKNRFIRLMAALLNNSVQYARENGYLYLAIIEKSAGAIDSNYEIRIEDNGEGMPQETVKAICDFFRKGEGSFSDEGLENSMEITVIKMILKQLKGTLDVESEQGTGTKFILNIPFKTA